MRDPRYKIMHNGEDLSRVTTDAGKRGLRGRVSRPEHHTVHPWN